ncbi:alpha amylase C-terminal domain-containing protein [Lentisphaerota bacterium ZTH]|nr:alpha amylase C-terminal domain-containing protein [Lentisphaerota bacterium]WET07400.1 alpha amylase C-terminal domain-containing protein [Lentisphaerota bacterium ZTH]
MLTAKPLPNKTAKLFDDGWLEPFRPVIERREFMVENMERRLTEGKHSLIEFANAHEYYGLHFRDGCWVFREWAPNASTIYLVGDFSGWQEQAEFKLNRLNRQGDWELELPNQVLAHGMHYRLRVHWHGGSGDRIPAYARYVSQDPETLVFSARVWKPKTPFVFKNRRPVQDGPLLVYESHVGMAQEREGVGSFKEYRENILPMLAESGYNTVQLMAIMSHPYYGSFGYHVANFYSICALFGTPDEFKELVDTAHGLGLRVIIDMVHSHAVKNEVEGVARFDGTGYQYFHEGDRGQHYLWDSLLFNYAKPEVLHFLLSNLRFWLDEYNIDGFRFDGVTSMLYHHHGLGHAFTSYDEYFGDQVDEDAIVYLSLANKVIHEVRQDAVTVAEDVSGMPGLGAPLSDHGMGFDYRLAMGVTDYWFKLFDKPDEDWSMCGLWHELTNRRQDEKTVSYVECHDQSIVGGQTAIFRMVERSMYDSMCVGSENMLVDRGIALHKMSRLITVATSSNGYLNFMGNEFGHPEWVDFPREGNGWSYKYCRRQWSLAEDKNLRYYYLRKFDQSMLHLIRSERIYDCLPQKILVHDADKIIAFERGSLFFFFNFNPSQSFSDYKLEVLPGEYEMVLDVDSPEFNGHGRLEPDQHFYTIPEKHGREVRNMISLYLPCRSGMVLRRI